MATIIVALSGGFLMRIRGGILVIINTEYRSSQRGAYKNASLVVGAVALLFVIASLMSSIFTI